MPVPFESRALLALASVLAPQDLRAEWRREWDAEIWWWLGTHPGERLQLAAHCSGALCDAMYLRASRFDLKSPSACLAALALLLAAVVASSGLSETRRVLHGEPFAGAGLAVLSQNLPFMGAHFGVPVAKVADWDARAQLLEGAAPYIWNGRSRIAHAGPKFFALLGTRAARGTLSQPFGAVVSYAYWHRHAGATIADGAQIIGVLPPDFWFLDLRPDIWILSIPPNTAQAPALARLKPGVKPADAQTELRNLVHPASSGSAVTVEPIGNLSNRPLTTLGIPWLVLMCGSVVASFACYRRTPRYGAFLAAKAVLSLTLVLLATVEFGSSWMTINSGETNLGAGMLSLWLFLAGPAAVLYWCWRDQRQRCRTCLHRLAMPVTFGAGARLLLERTGTELLCPHGHGTLFTPDGADTTQQWDPLDGSWRELFVGK